MAPARGSIGLRHHGRNLERAARDEALKRWYGVGWGAEEDDSHSLRHVSLLLDCASRSRGSTSQSAAPYNRPTMSRFTRRPGALRFESSSIALLALLIAALSLRLYGIDWDNGTYLHPDELHV